MVTSSVLRSLLYTTLSLKIQILGIVKDGFEHVGLDQFRLRGPFEDLAIEIHGLGFSVMLGEMYEWKKMPLLSNG